jgi:tetratricopeptide (TPR) repeat protein
MAKKISRKKLLKEPDEFISFAGRLIQFGKKYQEKLIGGIAVLFVLLAIISVIRYLSGKNESEASMLLSKAQTKYEKALSSKKPQEAYKEVEKDFQKLLNDFSGQMAGKQARLIFADVCFEAGKIDQAIELYKASLKDWNKDPIIKNIILSSLGNAYKKKEDYKNALSYYEQIRNGGESFGKANALYNLGVLYAKKDETQKSQKAFKMIDQDYSNYIYAEIVKDKIRP